MTTALSRAEQWLVKSPPTTHSAIEAYFRHVVQGRGVRDLDAIVEQVMVMCADKWSWVPPSSRQAYEDLLQVLRSDREGAQAYAQRIIDDTVAPEAGL